MKHLLSCISLSLCLFVPFDSGAQEAPDLSDRYIWLKGQESQPWSTLEREFAPPRGYVRVKTSGPGSYAAYLRGLPIRHDRTGVLLHTGRPVSMPSAAVVPLDLGPKDLHQCADSVIRLHAEYLWSQGRADEAAYHYTSGDVARWREYRQGRTLVVRGREVKMVKVEPPAGTHASYRKWLDSVFRYASTRSLHRDAQQVKGAGQLQAGDFLLQGGSPGHVVVILDVATNAKGENVALVGQGYLPAREFHLIKAKGKGVIDGVWFKISKKKGGLLKTPTWAPFKLGAQLWRFKVQ